MDPFSISEHQDNYDVIEWIASQPWSTGKVGQIGTSYGGITTLAAAGFQSSPHLAAIIPIMGTTDIYRDWAYQGGIPIAKTGGDARAQWPNGCSFLLGEATCTPRILSAWESHPLFDSYWQARAFDPHSIKVPTLLIDGVQDFWMVSADRTFRAIGDRADVSFVIGPWIHTIPGGDNINPELRNMFLAWFDRWLIGDVNAPVPPKVMVQGLQQANTADWRGFDAWPPRDGTPLTYYLTGSSALQVAAPIAGTVSYAVDSDGSTAGLTFATPPFTTATTMAGEALATLSVSFSASDGNLMVNLFDQAPDGNLTSIGIGAFQKMSHLRSSAAPQAIAADVPYDVQLRIPSKYWVFHPGHSLILTVSSQDPTLTPDAPAGRVSLALGASKSSLQIVQY